MKNGKLKKRAEKAKMSAAAKDIQNFAYLLLFVGMGVCIPYGLYNLMLVMNDGPDPAIWHLGLAVVALIAVMAVASLMYGAGEVVADASETRKSNERIVALLEQLVENQQQAE